MRLTGLSIASILLSSASAPACAAWTANGPDGGQAFSVATAGGVLRIGTTDGVYESIDGGANWTRLGDFPRGHWTVDVATHPTNASIILAPSYDQLYRSIDGGAHWLGTGQSLAHAVFHPGTPNDVLATDVNHAALHRSADAGATWGTITLPGGVPFPVGDVIADPAQAHAFYALTYSQPRLYHSVDGGLNWTPLSDASESGAASGALSRDPFDSDRMYWIKGDLDIARAERFLISSKTRSTIWSSGRSGNFIADPHTSGRLWIAGQPDSDLKLHLYESLDHGSTWPDAGAIPARLLGADSVTAGLLYGSDDFVFMHSPDSGRTWEARSHGMPLAKTSAVSIRPDMTSEILAAGPGYAVAISTDGGTSWSSSTNGLTSTTVNALVRSPQNAAEVYAGSDNGLFHSLDGGRNWQEVAIATYPYPDGVPRRFVQIDIDRDNPNLLFASHLWSDDAGVNWYDATINGNPDMRQIARSYNGTDRVYGLVWQSSIDYILYRADTHGATFNPTGGGLLMSAVAVHPSEEGTLIALSRNGVWNNWTAYRSRDAGDHWQTRGVLTLPWQGYEPQVRFDPCDPQTVYALAGSSFYVSPDQGLTWSEDPIAIPSIKFNDLDARCFDGNVAIAAATAYAGAQVRAPVAVNRIFVQGFEAD